MTTPTLTITLNGQQHQVAEGSTLAQALALLERPLEQLAVSVNQQIVPKSQWQQAIEPNANIQVFHAIAGG
ncbi:sulfur carrier protein ThiS [Paraferrimonas sedimenticola]|uniref:Sulfur carrier protein ThiS n=1 Tax=Paraferrimonas sedimenticola TaxID=375674 RepID=A0AA37VU73_9GAMM|nr:sulfur carrier protein ThiS [Paraferrimonas sedimenticola]GLP95694.1 hypothetical protein GCM10007895_10000 [Paraferrimonas sedimenticola]